MRIQGKHAGLRREEVLRAAVRLIDLEGVGALSMRRLARELGVEAMTLYHHVRSKEALEDAVVEYVLTESVQPSESFASWQEAITGYALQLHQGLLTHPGSVSLVANRPALTAHNLQALEDLLGILATAGFEPATGMHIVHATAVAVVGQHVIEQDRTSGRTVPERRDLPLVRHALASQRADLDTRLTFMLTALTVGFERLLHE